MQDSIETMHSELEQRLRFETLLAETSARFINVPADQVDREIEGAQRRICEFLNLDRSALGEAPQQEPGTLLLTHMYQPLGGPPIPERANAREWFPWTTQKVLAGETVTITKMSDLPPEAGRDRESYGLFGTKSVVVVPLSVGREPIFGFLTFSVRREERHWPETVVKGIRLVAQVFANALAQKRAETALRESEARLSLATSAAGVGLWIVQPETGQVWVTPKTQELFHFAPDQETNYESFLKVIHPEDRDRVNLAVRQAIQSGENLLIDYRIVLLDGSIRWIVARGQRYPESTGEPYRIMGVSLDVTEHKLADQALKERLEFEGLLSDLSARFIIVSPEQVNREIEHALEQIMEFFQVDRCGLVRIWKDKSHWEITHVVQRDEVYPLLVNTKMPANMFPWVFEKIVDRHEVVALESLRELPAEASIDKQSYEALGTKANLNIPVVDTQSDIYCLILNAIRSERTWPEVYIPRLRVLGEILGNTLERSRNAMELNERLREIEALKQRLETENIYLQEEVKTLAEHSEIVGQSPGIKKVLAQAQQVAQTDSTVLLLGETGTGKELLARVIHNLSRRKDRPLVTVNTASLAPTLIESELFGREKGAYTGAVTKQIGRFELADGSSLFLDEIGDLAPELQVKLLRVLQEGRFERLGSPKSIQANVRIIAATHRDLEEAVQQGKFREDLYYRLAVFPIHIPPLRERADDIPLMVRFFVNEFAEKMGKRIRNVPRKSIEALQRYSWPGNVRELRNVIERAVIVSSEDRLSVELPQASKAKSSRIVTLEEAERRHILEILETTRWRIKGPRGAAELLGLKPSTLYNTMSRLGIPTKQQKDLMST
jgi:formate hydrogenlyase transcriptional activator